MLLFDVYTRTYKEICESFKTTAPPRRTSEPNNVEAETSFVIIFIFIYCVIFGRVRYQGKQVDGEIAEDGKRHSGGFGERGKSFCAGRFDAREDGLEI